MFGFLKTNKSKLLAAIKKDDIEAVRELLKHVPLDIRYKGGVNLVRLCVEKRSIQSLAYVLEQGVDPNVKTKKGKVSITRAADDENIEMINLLLKHNAFIDIYDFEGESALHTAAKDGALGIVCALVEAGADIDAVSKSGETAERMAVRRRQAHVVQYLKQYREAKEKSLLLQYEKEYVKPIESNDNSVKHHWDVTDHQEITRIADKPVLNSRVSQIFNFEAQSLLTIVTNNNIKTESILRENFEDVALELLKLACVEYETKTDEKVASQVKNTQPWNNLNKETNTLK